MKESRESGAFPTTLFVDNSGNRYKERENCHDGTGPFRVRDLMAGVPDKLSIRFIHDDIIPPGSTFGVHGHTEPQSEEWYICLAGEGIMTNDDVDREMKPGDISVCYNGGSHGIRNTGQEDMRILVISGQPL